jgi:hypothetical protein
MRTRAFGAGLTMPRARTVWSMDPRATPTTTGEFSAETLPAGSRDDPLAIHPTAAAAKSSPMPAMIRVPFVFTVYIRTEEGT